MTRLAAVHHLHIAAYQLVLQARQHLARRPADGGGGADAALNLETGIHLEKAEIGHSTVVVAQRLGQEESFLHVVEQSAPARLTFPQAGLRTQLLGGFHAGAEHAPDIALRVAQRRIGEREAGLLLELVALHPQGESLEVHRLTSPCAQDHRMDKRPDLRPCLDVRPAQRCGVPSAQQWYVAVVVETAVLITPEQEHREFRGQHQRYHGLQRVRPQRGFAQRRRRPVMCAHARAHFPAVGKKALVVNRGQENLLGQNRKRRTAGSYLLQAGSRTRCRRR